MRKSTEPLHRLAIRALFASLLSVALLTLSELLEAFPLVRHTGRRALTESLGTAAAGIRLGPANNHRGSPP